MCLSLFVFTQLFSEVAQSQPSKPARKQNLTRNSQSRSFKVMHFLITEKPTTDCISPCNNAGFISKVYIRKNSQRKRWKLPFSTTPLSFDAPLRRTSANIRINLIPREIRVIVLHMLLTLWAYLHSNFCDGLRKTHLFCNRVRIGRSMSSKVVGFGVQSKGRMQLPVY